MKLLRHPQIVEKTVHSMLFAIGVCSLIYCAVLLSLVFSVIERKQNVLASHNLTSRLSSLELEYASKVASIDDGALVAEQYKRVDTTFAVRKDPIASYTLLYAK
jgi:hypothetical protein